MDKNVDNARVDILSSLILAENVISGSATKERRLISSLALSIASQNRTFREDELRALSLNQTKLAIISNFQQRVKQSCQTDFLFWHRMIIPVYFKDIYDNKTEAVKLSVINNDCRRGVLE